MSKISYWISAFRLRTLFLAISSVILGSGIAWQTGKFSMSTMLLALLLAISIQILSNLANDLGDFQKGTDTTGKRQGPARTVQSGKITPRQMKTAVVINSIIVAVIGLTLIANAIETMNKTSAFILLSTGLVCILSALFYTMGKYAYGYVGLGDLFAFLFFGPVAVVGTYFIHTNSFDWQPVAPSTGLGFISTMILNINNMRDIENDKVSKKITVASIIGLKNAKIYHSLLTTGVILCFIFYSVSFSPSPWYKYIYTLVFLFQINILIQIYKKRDRELDPYLKLTSLTGFILILLFVVCINL